MGVPYAEVIGDPIAHSKSPIIHRHWLKKLGIEGDYRAIRVRADELVDYLASRRQDPDWRGCNVTIPHKQRIMRLLDDVRDFDMGAVNCIIRQQGRLIGLNTDSEGVGEAFKRAVDTSAPTCVLGAGGAARAVIAWLDILAVHRWRLIARDRAKAQALSDKLGMQADIFGFEDAESALAGAIGVVNATPLGMTGFPEMPDSVLHGLQGLGGRRFWGIKRGAFALDMVYTPARTAFLAAATSAGIEVKDGLTVLIGQAAGAFLQFFGASPPREHDIELRELLTS